MLKASNRHAEEPGSTRDHATTYSLRMPATPRLLQPLRARLYRRFWLAAGFSFAGDGLYIVAIAWHASGLDNPILSLSVVGIATTVPNLVATLLGGALADRIDRRMILLTADLVRAAAVGAMAALAWRGSLDLVALAPLVALLGLASSVANPTLTAYLPSLVDRAALPQANALLSMTRTLSWRVLGPAAAGVLIVLGGVELCFLVDALSFVVSAGALASLPAHRAMASAGSLVAKVVEGLRFTNGQPWLKLTLLANCLGLLFYVGPFYVLIPLLVRQEFGGGAGAFSTLEAVAGAAAFVGAGVAAHLQPGRPVVWAYVLWIVAFAAYGAYALAPTLPVVVVIAAVSLGAGFSADVLWQSTLQARVPDAMLGRVASLDAFATLGSIPLSIALAAPAAGLFGIRPVFLVGGAVAAGVHVVAALLLFSSKATAAEPGESEAVLAHANATQRLNRA